MSKALIYILYHPGALVNYNLIRNKEKNDLIHILLICDHPYTDKESIDVYLKGFTNIIHLPDIDYDNNIYRGLKKCAAFLKKARAELAVILKNVKSFNVISEFSAQLPVNTLLSELKNDPRFNKSISVSKEYVFELKPDILKSVKTVFYTLLLRLYPVYYHKTLACMYFKKIHDKNIQVVSLFGKDVPEAKKYDTRSLYSIIRPPLETSAEEKNTVIFYSDMSVQEYGCELSPEAYKDKLGKFFKRLSAHYEGYNIVCKTHPLDGEKVMWGMEAIKYELYKGKLISQMHLDINARKVKACYSVASTSLWYPASLGIPSYTIYKYLGFKGKYPEEFFKADNIATTPFSYNISLLDEIGAIDSLQVELKKETIERNWDEFMEWPDSSVISMLRFDKTGYI